MENYQKYGPTVLRVFVGLLFVVPGLFKLTNPSMAVDLLTSLGFGAAGGFFAWVLILSEIIFGAAVLVGWKVKYAVWPLVVIMLVAIVMVVIPSFATDPMAAVSLAFHLLAVAGLISLFLTGPGAWAVEKQA